MHQVHKTNSRCDKTGETYKEVTERLKNKILTCKKQ